MPNHASASKRVRSDAYKRQANRIKRNACLALIKQVRKNKKAIKEPQATLGTISSMLDKLAKKHIIHRHKCDRLKARMSKMLG